MGTSEAPLPTFPAAGEFHFIRMEYTDLPNHHRGFGFASRTAQGNGWWVVDWPDADFHFSEGVRRLTRVDTGAPLHMSLTDDKTFRQSVDLRDAGRLVGFEQGGDCAAARISAARRFLGRG